MKYCLSKNELLNFIDHIINKTEINEETRTQVESAKNWHDQLICLSYFLSIILERKKQDGEDCQKIIDEIYQQPEELFLSIQEFDSDFVHYIIRHTRNRSLSLEDDLILLQNDLAEHLYDKAIRY